MILGPQRVNSAVRRVQDLMRMDPGVDGDAQRLAQLVGLLFLRTADVHDCELAEATGRRAIPVGARWQDWAEGGVPDHEVVAYLSDTVLPMLRALDSKSDPLCRLISSAARDSHNSMTSGALLREVTEQLHLLAPSRNSERHVLGDVYEQLLAGLREAGNAGEFYTPRPLTDLVAELVDVRPGETVLDPACGTGGFLLSALEHCRAAHLGDPLLLGIEKKALPHLLALTNLLLHGVLAGEAVLRGNGLLDRIGRPDGVDVIITNPPFGGSEEGDVTSAFPSGFRTRETADLFVYSMINRLRDGGRAGVIIPDGLLFGGGPRQRIRRELLDVCRVDGVLRLPAGVFAPYTDIKTNILLFTKAGPTRKVWFFEQPAPAAGKKFTQRRPISRADLEGVRRWWRKKATGPQAWLVDAGDLPDARLDPDNPHEELREQSDPATALADYKAVSDTTKRAADDLSALIAEWAPNLWRRLSPAWGLWMQSPASTKRVEQLLIELAAQGRLTAGKREPQMQEEGPHPIPASWKWTRVDVLGRVLSGGTPKTHDPDAFDDEGLPWITPADLRGNRCKYVRAGRRGITPHGLATSSAVVLPQGSVVFSSRAPIGYVAIAGCELATNQGFKSVVPHDPADSDVIYYLLRAAVPRIERDARGTTFKEVPARQMKDVLLAMPPAEERTTLVAALDAITGAFDHVLLAQDGLPPRADAALAASERFLRAR